MEVVETAQGTTYTGADIAPELAKLQAQQPSNNDKPKDQLNDVVINDPIAGQTPSDNDGGKKSDDGGGKKDGSKGSGDVDGKQSLPDMKENPPNVPGYKPPKSGAQKVRNPNGKGIGWVDRDGRVWVPDDHNGTRSSLGCAKSDWRWLYPCLPICSYRC
ncbi:polymorphic toxin type 37 domain-containing protein [Pedobacter sp. L105]|uniref:polymorphic toxin type 37 domain-containing protein n=1 Tax=Pedobacter sp. L105 TaxID=1641871 RepID=UPI0020B13F30|nr:hypothetical protein [Pedobacter sp. L105]